MTFIALVAPIYYNVKNYGAVGDTKTVTDGAITTGTASLTSSTAGFTSADVGKLVTVNGAGASSANLNTTISAYVSTTQVTLAANASTTVSSASVTYGTDDTTAITNARSAANSAGGGTVVYPQGTYTTGNQTLYANVIDMGAGSGCTIIKLKNGANTDLFSASTGSINLAASYGSGSTGGAHDFAICGLTLDGNKANQTSGTSYCVRVYGYRFLVRDVIIQNGFTGGWLSDWNGGSSAPGANIETTATWDNVFCCNNNGIGFQVGGPHDSRMKGCNSYLNGSHCFHIAPNMVGLKADQCHGYASPAGVSAVPWLIEASYSKFTDCIAEGADNTEVVFLAQDSSWMGGHIFADTTPNSVIGIQLGQHSGNTPWPSSINQSAGVTTAVIALGNVIDTTISECQGGAISFADEWKSFYRIYCHQSGGTAVASTLPDPTDNFWIVVVGLTPDGSLGKSGGMQIASSAFNGLTFWDQSGSEFFAVNPNSQTFGMGHGGIFRGYSDGFTTLQWSIESTHGNIATNGNIAIGQSASASAIASSGTITTANTGEARVAPTAAVTGIILQSGTIAGQTCTVVNESAFTLTMAASGTSHVADGVANIIPPNSQRSYTWDSSTSLWYGQSTAPVQSSTAVSTASSGTIATAGLDVSRVTTSGAITGVILAAGTYAGQTCTVVNESANSITFAAVATSNVADGVSAVIAANRCMYFKWDSGTSKWYHS